MVNWKSETYLKWQIRMLYDFHDPKKFRLVIVDNSGELFAANYVPRYSGLEIWKRIRVNNHGWGLTRVLRNANSDYFLAQDPDFFWLRKHHLDWLEDHLQDNVAVGAEYPGGVSVDGSDPTFPACWGCAFRKSKIKELDFLQDGLTHTNGKDTGWKMRVALQNDPFISFKHGRYEGPYFGQANWLKNSRPFGFFEDGKQIAAHMFRGEYTEKSLEKFPYDKIQDQYARHFYESAV